MVVFGFGTVAIVAWNPLVICIDQWPRKAATEATFAPASTISVLGGAVSCPK